jgi:MazG family protein
MNTTADEFNRLIQIMDDLRQKCPWDKKQTINTLRYLTIEETYELTDAIDEEDWNGIKEELGDLLLHIVFYAKLGTETNKFSLEEVISGICEKLIYRHPHIYGEGAMAEGLAEVVTDDDVKQNWEKLKLKEGKKTILSGVPKSLPSIVKAIRLQEKTKTVGFEWENTDQVWDKVHEEINELKQAIDKKDGDAMEDETGDVLFSIVNLARFLQVDADCALERTNKKFIRRFNAVEEEAIKQNKTVNDLTLAEMDEIWNTIKAKENNNLQ